MEGSNSRGHEVRGSLVDGGRLGSGLLLLVAAPPIVGLVYALWASLGWIGPPPVGGDAGVGRILRVTVDPSVRASLLWTGWIALTSTLLSTFLAVGTALALRNSVWGNRLLRPALVLPLPIPHLVAALLGLLILGQSGFLARIAFHAGLIEGPGAMPALVYDRWGIGLITSLVWKEFAFLLLVATSLLGRAGSSMEEAARTLGASPRSVLVRLTLPLLLRGMIPAILAVFAFVLGSYEAAVLLAPSHPLPLSVLTYERYHDPDFARRGDAYVLALLGFLLALALVGIHEWARSRWRSVA